MIRWTMLNEQIGQTVKHIVRVQLAPDDDGQAPSGELVDHRQHTERLSVMRSIHDEVIGPDVVGPSGLETYAGPIIEPQPPAFGLFLGNLQPLPPPDALNPFSIYLPTFGSQQGSDPSITVSAILAGQADDRCRQSVFVRPATRRLARGRAMLTDNTTRSAFLDAQFGLKMINALPATGGA